MMFPASQYSDAVQGNLTVLYLTLKFLLSRTLISVTLAIKGRCHIQLDLMLARYSSCLHMYVLSICFGLYPFFSNTFVIYRISSNGLSGSLIFFDRRRTVLMSDLCAVTGEAI